MIIFSFIINTVVEYWIVKPATLSNTMTLPEDYIDYFQSLPMPLLIGHRGMGAHDAKDA